MAHQHDDHRPPTKHAARKTDAVPDDPREATGSLGSTAHDRDVREEAARASHEHGPDRHAGHSAGMFRRRFWLSLVLTVPTVAFGHMIPSALGREPFSFPGSWLIPPVFGVVVFSYGGWPFLEGAARELRARLPGMMTLIALAISVAFAFSVAVTIGYPGMPLWEELSTLVTIMLLGHWIEMRSISQAQGALKELAKLLPRTAVRVVDSGREEEIPLEQLRDGDLVLVRPGASVPADGIVRSGESSLDEGMITGESRLIARKPGDQVVAGTVNGAGSLRVEVTGTGEHTALARIMGLVARAQASRSRAQALADRAALLLTLVAIAAAAATAVGWWIAGASGAFIAERVVTVLVIACPHALGLAIPLVIAISTTLAARAGLLVRNRRGLEEARRLEEVVFDKTGTLTLGQHRVVAVRAAEGLAEDEALRIAAAVERDSEHPVARAVLRTAQERGIDVPLAAGFRAIPGQGVEAEIGGHRWMVGGPNLVRRVDARPSPALEQFAREAAGRGQAVIHLVEGSEVRAAFAVADAVRPEAREAVRDLHRAGIRVAMLTGDARAVADAVARDLGIEEVHAEVVPEKKAEAIASLKRGGRRVAMVGDGVNDAPALVTADVGVAMGAGTDVAVEAGDVVLVRSDPRAVSRIIALSRASYRKMLQNLWWAAGYNVIAIPLAAGVLAAWGVLLGPAVGAVLMSASTVIVAVNAQLLRRAVA